MVFSKKTNFFFLLSYSWIYPTRGFNFVKAYLWAILSSHFSSSSSPTFFFLFTFFMNFDEIYPFYPVHTWRWKFEKAFLFFFQESRFPGVLPKKFFSINESELKLYHKILAYRIFMHLMKNLNLSLELFFFFFLHNFKLCDWCPGGMISTEKAESNE